MRKSNKKTNKSTVSNNGILHSLSKISLKKEINNSCSIISNFMWTFNGT